MHNMIQQVFGDIGDPEAKNLLCLVEDHITAI